MAGSAALLQLLLLLLLVLLQLALGLGQQTSLDVHFRVLNPLAATDGAGENWVSIGRVLIEGGPGGPSARWLSFSDHSYKSAVQQARNQMKPPQQGSTLSTYPAVSFKLTDSSEGRIPLVTTKPLELLWEQQQQRKQQKLQGSTTVKCKDVEPLFSLEIHLGSRLNPVGVTVFGGRAASDFEEQQRVQQWRQQKLAQTAAVDPEVGQGRTLAFCTENDPALILRLPPSQPSGGVVLPPAAEPQPPLTPEQEQQQQKQQQQPSLFQRFWWVLPLIVVLHMISGGLPTDSEDQAPPPSAPARPSAAPRAAASSGRGHPRRRA